MKITASVRNEGRVHEVAVATAGSERALAIPAKAAGGGTKLKAPPKKVRQRQQVKKGAHGGTLIVLIEDVAHLGKQGDLVEVKPGYARNYLLQIGRAHV